MTMTGGTGILTCPVKPADRYAGMRGEILDRGPFILCLENRTPIWDPHVTTRQETIMSNVTTSGPDAQGKFSLEVNIGGLTGTISGFSSKMEGEDYAVSLLRRVKELAKADGLK